MADVTISQLTPGTPAGSSIVPYSTGTVTLGVPVSAMFQNTNSRICINGTTSINSAPGLQINNGSIFISNSGGNQVAMTDGPQRWDLDVDAGVAHALRIRNMSYPEGLTSTMLVIATAGHVTMPFQPAFHVWNQVNQTLTNNTVMQFNAATSNSARVFNQGGHYANNKFTAPVAGLYQFSLNVLMNTSAGGDARYIGFVLNGSDLLDYAYVRAGQTYQSFNVSATIKLAATDYIEVRAFGADASMNMDNSGTFSGHLVG